MPFSTSLTKRIAQRLLAQQKRKYPTMESGSEAKVGFDQIAEEVRSMGGDYVKRYTMYGPNPKMKLWAFRWKESPKVPLEMKPGQPAGIALTDAIYERSADEGVAAISALLLTLREKYPAFTIEMSIGGGWQPWDSRPKIPSLVVRPKAVS